MTSDLLERAQSGDREAFGALVSPIQPRLRGTLRRILQHPDDVDDVLQKTLLKAWQSLSTFRRASKLTSWLHTIATRQAVDFLRGQKRYRTAALLFAQDDCVASGSVADVMALLDAPDFHFDVREHIAYCFACVGRSLEPEEQAALVLREVHGMSNAAGAKELDLSHAVFRHHLAAARRKMTDRYDRLCALVSKRGVCYQCEGLREGAREGQRGEEPREALSGATRDDKWKRRLAIVEEADVDTGRSRRLHDLLARQLDALERRRESDEELDRVPVPATTCEPPPKEENARPQE